MEIKKYILGNAENLSKKIFFWNMAGSMLNALSSMLLSIIVARVTGEVTAGIFLFGFTIAQQMLTVGCYEMRPYQSTDVQHAFSFPTYLASRIVTCIAMLVFSIPFIAVSGGNFYNCTIAFLMCVYKMFDAAEDIFHGMLQQNGRLDVAGKALFFRVLISTVAFLIVLYITHDLIITALFGIVVAFLSFAVLNISTAKEFESIRPDFSFAPLKKLLITCFPLFAGSFMLLYIYSAPKYAIQRQLSQEYQTYYNALFMPTFVINLFSSFALKPLLTTLANSWVQKRYKSFHKMILKLVVYIFAFTLFSLVVAYFLGIPVLSWMYKINLSAYRFHLLALLLGGGFNALSVVFYYAVTVMRKQRCLLLIYFSVFLLSVFLAPFLVEIGQMTGASICYLILMVVLSIVFVCVLVYFFKKAVKENTGH